MKTLNLIQGSEQWHQHRATSRNASDAPVMLGTSPYKTRNQLLHERATGIVPEVDESTQRRFDGGHRYEALARPLAEKIIGEELSPVTGVEGKYSASFDGITFDETVWWEHKWLNKELQSILANVPEVNVTDLPEHYRVQLEQQAMVSGGEKGLFMASKWDADGQLLEELHCWYTPDLKLRERIEAGWEQFEKDLEEYKRKLADGTAEVKDAPVVAEVIMDLPSLSVQATGMVTYSNLPEFKKAAEEYLANINTELVTDQHFADAEATVKFCKTTEETLEISKKAILAQTASIDEVIRTVEYIQAQLRDKRLDLDKKVKTEKEKRKAEIVQLANIGFNEYLLQLEVEIRPIRLQIQPSFANAMKGLKKISAMQDAVDTALRDGKYAADQVAKDIRAKLAWCKENAAGMSMLFPDLQQIIGMETEAFQATIKNRIAEYKEVSVIVAIPQHKEAQDALKGPSVMSVFNGTNRPTDAQIVEALAKSFDVSPDTARFWLKSFGKEETNHAQGSQKNEAEAVELRRKAVQLAEEEVRIKERRESYRRLNPNTTFKKEHPEG